MSATDVKKEDDTKAKRNVKINVQEGEDDFAEGETGGRKRSKRFQLPDLPRWWQAKIIQYAFLHPHVRARLEKLMGSNLVQLTDKSYMRDLEERIREVNEEQLEKRVSARVLDEMERLKRLILVGKTPLTECPPELYHHPVFVFWRMVNKEVARACKKRADNYFRKIRSSKKSNVPIESPIESEGEEEAEQLTAEQLLAKCMAELLEQKQLDIDRGVRFTDEVYKQLKYETPDVVTLKNLTTVEELYTMADKIIGTKRMGVPT